MDEDAVLIAIGELKGEVKGIGREIGEIKESLKCKTEDCRECRKEIDGNINAQGKRIDGIATTHTGEAAIKSWQTSSVTFWGAVIALLLGAFAGIVQAWNFLRDLF